MPLPDLAPFGWALLLAGSFIVGISKTALPGAATLSVAAFAAVLPAKASTGALLVLLIVGDVFALALYRRDADLRTLLRLAPAVLVGLVLGSVFLALSDDRWVKLVIGVILLALTAFTLWRRGGSGAAPGGGRAARVGYGALGGFTTMVANAGGPVMSLYFLAARFPVRTFLGTAAWFFAIINVAKLPFSIGLGLLDWSTFSLDLVLAPAVVAGALIGRWIAGRIRQAAFDRVVVAMTVLGAWFLILAALKSG